MGSNVLVFLLLENQTILRMARSSTYDAIALTYREIDTHRRGNRKLFLIPVRWLYLITFSLDVEVGNC